MKRNIIILSFVLAALSACEKSGGPAVTEALSPVTVTVSANSGTGATKTVTPADDPAQKNVSSLHVFVFSEDGTLICSQGSKDGSSVLLTLQASTTGSVRYLFVTVANNWDAASGAWKLDLSGCSSRDDIFGTVSKLPDNASGDLLMVGESVQDISKATTEVSIDVHRLVSKIELRKIVVNFANELLSTKNLALKGVYVINAADRITLGGVTPGDFDLYNDKRYTPSDADKITYDGVTPPVTLNWGATQTATPYESVHTFFVYANPSAEEENHTRLVIEVLFNDEETLYYSSDLGEIGTNKAYVITRANIEGMGVTDPMEDPDRAHFSVTANVIDWETGFSKELDF